MIVDDCCKKQDKRAEGVNCGKLHPTEVKFPEQTKAFRELTERMYQIHLEKNLDYSPANILVTGEPGVIVRIWDKFCRICNLSGMTFPVIHKELSEAKEIVESGLEEMGKNLILEKINECIRKSSFDFSNMQEKKPANESLDDAWLDMATYSIIGYLKRQNKWGR